MQKIIDMCTQDC